MRSLEKEGKTVDEAIWNGLQELGLSRDRVRIEILDQGSRGLFGIGARPARVLLLEKEIEEELDIRGILRGEAESKPAKVTEPEKPHQQPATSAPRPATERSIKKPSPRTDSAAARRTEACPPSEVERDRKSGDITEAAYPTGPRSEASHRIAEQLQRQQTTLPSRSIDHLKNPPRQEQGRTRRAPYRQDSRSSGRMSSVRPPKDLVIPSEGAPALLYSFLTELFQAMELPCSVGVTQEDNTLQASVYGEGDDLGLLIGKHGATLDSLQYLASLAVNRGSEGHLRVQVQIGDYRQRREDTLIRLANRIAEKVLREGEPQALEPMLASERRIIHLALQEHPHVETMSEGEEPHRHVVVQLKQNKSTPV